LAARIVGVGQEWAGDDAVGIAVLRKLGEDSASVELIESAEPTGLIELLADGADPVVIVDAVLDDGPAGRVLLIDPHSQSGDGERLLSTHGVGIIEAIELARLAYSNRIAKRIFVVGVAIGQSARHGKGLSPAVAAAVPLAAKHVLKLIGESRP
jgi:hydrogenase maturation protease